MKISIASERAPRQGRRKNPAYRIPFSCNWASAMRQWDADASRGMIRGIIRYDNPTDAIHAP